MQSVTASSLAGPLPNSSLADLSTSTTTAPPLLPQLQLLPCYMVNNLTRNTEEQCKFMLDNDCLEDEATIDYVHLVYCDISHEFRHVSVVLVLTLVVVLFLNLSAVADEFLCPSLLTVARSLRMSDSLAGVTLLAFGNGCPDIFSSIAAASSGRPEIIVGELLGAGIFCTSIVAGLIFIHSDFKLARRPLLRDATFYLLAVYLIWLYCHQEVITFYGSLAFIIIYVIYLFFALSGQAINSRLRGEYPIEEEAQRQGAGETKCPPTHNQDELEFWLRWREESLRRGSLVDWTLSGTSQLPQCDSQKVARSSLVLSDELTTIKISYKRPEKLVASQTLKMINCDKCQLGHSDQTNGEKMSVVASVPSISLKCHQQQQLQQKTYHSTAATGNTKQILDKSGQDRTQANKVMEADIDNSKRKQSSSDLVTLTEFAEFLAHASPIKADEWAEASWLRRIVLVLRAPLLLVAILTVPVVDSERRNNNWNRMLNSAHCVLVPLAILLFTGLGAPDLDEEIDDDGGSVYPMTQSLIRHPAESATLMQLHHLRYPAIGLPGLALAAFVLYSSRPDKPPKYHAAFSYFGFLMSVLWIYLLATEIISILKTVGIIFSMTDTAIGLGVLAWGNSLGDIVANLTLAQAGYARMALGASIGAPLLNLLLGFGLSFTLSLQPGHWVPIEYTPTTSLLAATLALILLLLMCSTLLPAQYSRRPLGYLLISCYGVYFALAVCFECGLIKF